MRQKMTKERYEQKLKDFAIDIAIVRKAIKANRYSYQIMGKNLLAGLMFGREMFILNYKLNHKGK
jgi:hypothetical protein